MIFDFLIHSASLGTCKASLIQKKIFYQLKLYKPQQYAKKTAEIAFFGQKLA